MRQTRDFDESLKAKLQRRYGGEVRRETWR
jgi:hypothetical protein